MSGVVSIASSALPFLPSATVSILGPEKSKQFRLILLIFRETLPALGKEEDGGRVEFHHLSAAVPIHVPIRRQVVDSLARLTLRKSPIFQAEFTTLIQIAVIFVLT